MSARYCFFDGLALTMPLDANDFAACANGHTYGADFLATLDRLEPVEQNMTLEDVTIEAYGWVGAPDSTEGLGDLGGGWYHWRHIEGGLPTEWHWVLVADDTVPASPGLMYQLWS